MKAVLIQRNWPISTMKPMTSSHGPHFRRAMYCLRLLAQSAVLHGYGETFFRPTRIKQLQ